MLLHSGAPRSAPLASLVFALALAPTAARADLRFTQVRADRGEVKSGPSLVERFSFVNAGPGVIDILDTRTSCGCLKPRFSKRQFQPDEEGWVELEVHTLSQPAGPNSWRLDMTYRDGSETRDAALILSARLSADIRVEPASLSISTDQKASHEICITDLRPKAMNVTAVDTSSPHLKATLLAPCRDMAGRAVRIIKLELAADFPEGKREEVLGIHTDDPAYRDLKVPINVTKRLRQRVSLAPDRITISATAGEALPSRIVLVRDADNQTVRIQEIKADDPALLCRWAAGPNTMATIKLQVDPEQLAGRNLDTKVHVRIVEPVPQTLTLTVEIRLQERRSSPENR